MTRTNDNDRDACNNNIEPKGGSQSMTNEAANGNRCPRCYHS